MKYKQQDFQVGMSVEYKLDDIIYKGIIGKKKDDYLVVKLNKMGKSIYDICLSNSNEWIRPVFPFFKPKNGNIVRTAIDGSKILRKFEYDERAYQFSKEMFDSNSDQTEEILRRYFIVL